MTDKKRFASVLDAIAYKRPLDDSGVTVTAFAECVGISRVMTG
jgi:hypothetical protein